MKLAYERITKQYKRLVKAYKRFCAYFPSRLPVGMTEFDKWSDSILDISSVPNNDSTKFALATTILHLPPTACYKPKDFFLRTLNKSASNQVAAGIMQELKDKQLAKAKAEQAEQAAIDASATRAV